MKPSSLHKFNKGQSQSLYSDSSSRGSRQPIPGPTSPLQFFGLLLFSILKKPMFVNIPTKAGFYICAVAAGSLLFDFIKIPSSYFSDKKNVFNLLFVKWGWAWTFVSLSLFIILSAYIYTGGNSGLIRAHLMRLIVGSAFWYVCTGTFNSIEYSFGQCYNMNGNMISVSPTQASFTRRSCRQVSGHWLGFDISGHCFLLILCNLWILEELRVMRSWSVLGSLLGSNDSREDELGSFTSPRLPNVSDFEFAIMRSSYKRHRSSLHVVFCGIACLSLIWDLMLFSTIIYFHSMPSKLLGAFFAISSWFLCYQVIFPSIRIGGLCGLAPGLPGDGPLHFMSPR